MLVDVVDTDKQGNPVTGLRVEDFAVQDKGKRQKIAFFTAPNLSQTSPAPATPARNIFQQTGISVRPAGRWSCCLLDAANTPFRDQAYARQQMLKFVQEQDKPGQRIAIFTLTNSLGVLQDFTSDPSVLLERAAEVSTDNAGDGQECQRLPRESQLRSFGGERRGGDARGSGDDDASGPGGMVDYGARVFSNVQLAYVRLSPGGGL